jgi:NAD-dependent dihydropyrimidine dehydrogenase PreA subunit
MSDACGRVLYCHCANAKVVPTATKTAVLEGLNGAQIEFEAVPDLCEMAARGDTRLRDLASSPELTVAACYPRAVKWLFASAGAPLPETTTKVWNMRVETPEAVVEGVLNANPRRADPERVGRRDWPTPSTPPSQPATLGPTSGWKPWFPVIDYSRCTNCMQCLSFCLFDVYGVSADQKIQVQNQSNCKTECPACSRVCPEVAIMFPKYRHGPINGEEIKSDDVRREAMKVDISALLGGDVYSMLRDRSVKAKSRFSKERDDDRALQERQNCLVALKKDFDIPAEVLAALPSPEQILARAEAAKQRAEAALKAASAASAASEASAASAPAEEPA